LLAGTIDKLPAACMGAGIHICADKTHKLVRWVEDGKVKLSTHVRFGVVDGAHDTPEGSYNVYYKSRDAVSRINCIPKSYDGCLAPMPFALFFNGDIAVHFSPPFSAYGYYPGGGSHGCVNVRSQEDATWMFDNTPQGTPVIVYSS
jgi:lipoprotein-anchoring transpeptidase ErfK/SrfK